MSQYPYWRDDNVNGKVYLLINIESFCHPVAAAKPVDLSSLAYDQTIGSRIFYFLLLFSTFVSVCTAFARILKQGEKPVIRNVLSFQ